MFERDNRTYYARRSAQATKLGDLATDRRAAAAHYELALRYAILSIRSPNAKPEPTAHVAERTDQSNGAVPAPHMARHDGSLALNRA